MNIIEFRKIQEYLLHENLQYFTKEQQIVINQFINCVMQTELNDAFESEIL